MNKREQYMQRCLELACKGQGHVAPNPMVGAVLVHNDIIIGEGWHQQYGAAHAEVNCIAAVKEEHRSLIPQSTLYVSLEPCAHFGKTPPCADLIIRNNIPEVIIGCRDTYSEVSGKGIKKLTDAGIKTETGVLEDACRWLNRNFFTFHEQKRPHIILKWAESANGFIAPADGKPTMLSNQLSQRLVHKMRKDADGIMVGYNTALGDNPRLNNRLWDGKDPVRIVLDNNATLPTGLHLLDNTQPTIIFNYIKQEEEGRNCWVKIDPANALPAILAYLYERKITSLIVEGGTNTLQRFINSGLWDEALIIKTPAFISNGIKAPILSGATIKDSYWLATDHHLLYTHEQYT